MTLVSIAIWEVRHEQNHGLLGQAHEDVCLHKLEKCPLFCPECQLVQNKMKGFTPVNIQCHAIDDK